MMPDTKKTSCTKMKQKKKILFKKKKNKQVSFRIVLANCSFICIKRYLSNSASDKRFSFARRF